MDTDEWVLLERGPPLRDGPGRTVPAGFLSNVQCRGTALALEGADLRDEEVLHVELSYQQLHSRVARGAAMMLKEGEGLQRMVALFVEEAVPLVISMLTVLWAGGAFVPVDLAHWPVERCQVVLEVSEATSALARLAQRSQVEQLIGELPIFWYEEMLEEQSERSVAEVSPSDLCYAIFTSGSTGRPKCVLCEHRSAVAYAVAKAEVEELAPGGRQLLASHFTFDPAQGDVFGALCRGASVVAPRRAAVLGALQEVLQGMRVSHATMTPTQWALKGSGDLPDLQHLTLCGEPMRRDTIDSWASKVQLRNMYGVTEATGVQTFHRMRAGDSAKLVGKALPGYLLGLTQENEVLVAGKGLARGYLGLEEETARCFVPWDLLTDDIEADGRAYRTGDLASWSAEKGFELHGRRDHQVKISGVRIESLEIELAVEASGLVESCTCMVQNDQLVAHCVLSSTMDWVLRAALEAHAAKRLPLQVVPHFFVGHEKLPLAPGGKVDRQALMASDLQEEPELEALGTPLEVAVATAWAKVLQRPAHSIGANSNFQWLGGDSLAALRASRGLAEEVLLPEDSVSESQEQAGEAGLMVSSEAPEGAVCVLRAALGPLAPCELLARPMLRQYATFLASKGVRDKGASQVSCATETGTLPELALIAAAGDGREAVVKALLEVASPDGPARGRPPRGQVPLIAAATAGHIGCAQLLLSARAHVRAMTSARTSAAHVAAARGDPSLLQLLLTTGDNDEREGIATWARDADQQTVLHLSARSGDLKCLELILSKVKGLKAKDGGLEAKDRWGRTALQWAVANGHKDAAVCLIRNGAYSKNLPDALLEDLEVNLTAPSKPGQPTALRKVVQPAERMGVLVQSLPQANREALEKELFALTALRDFCCGAREHRDAAVALGAVPQLLALLSSAQEEVAAAAAQTLRNIAADRSGASAVHDAGGLAPLLALATRGARSGAAFRAASALTNLAEWPELVPALKEAGTVAVLRKLSGQIPSSLA